MFFFLITLEDVNCHYYCYWCFCLVLILSLFFYQNYAVIFVFVLSYTFQNLLLYFHVRLSLLIGPIHISNAHC